LFILGVLFWWKEKRREIIALTMLIFIPIIGTLLFSKKIPVYLDRNMMPFSPFYYLIISAGLAKIKKRVIRSAAYLSISVPILFCLHNYFSYQMPLPLSYHIGAPNKKPVKPAADFIKAEYKEGDLVAYSDFSISQIVFYLPDIPSKRVAYFFVASKIRNDAYLRFHLKQIVKFKLQAAQDSNIVNLEQEPGIPYVKSLKDLEFKRAWLVSSSWSRDGKLEPHVVAVRKFMRDNYLLLKSKEFDGIFIDLYAKN
jgi:hypothetical protein